MKLNLKLAYLYLFSAIGLVVAVIGAVRLVDLGLKVTVFKYSDVYEYAYTKPLPSEIDTKVSTEEAKLQEEEMKRNNLENTKRQRQREASGAISMLLIGTPLYFYHWRLVKKEK